MTDWTTHTPEQRRELVRQAVQTEGLTYSQAAARLGTSRLSIAGIIERTKNSANPIVSGSGRKNGGSQQVKRLGAAKVRARKAAKKKTPKPRHAGLRALVALSPPIAPEPIPPDEIWQALDGTTPVSIEAHHDGACRWPIDRPAPFAVLYCNAPIKPDSVYCERHSARAYRELPTVKAKRKETA